MYETINVEEVFIKIVYNSRLGFCFCFFYVFNSNYKNIDI